MLPTKRDNFINCHTQIIIKGSVIYINKKGQSGLTGAFINIMIAVIIGVGVAIPVVIDIIANSSITGMTATILNYLPLLMAVVLLVAVAVLVK